MGTTTEIYDYLRLLFARVGVPHCPECGREIKKQTTDQVTDDILRLGDDAQGESTKAILMAPVVAGRKGEFTKLFADLQKEGFSRVRIRGRARAPSGPSSACPPTVCRRRCPHAGPRRAAPGGSSCRS